MVAGETLDVQSGRGMNVAVVSTEGALESFQARNGPEDGPFMKANPHKDAPRSCSLDEGYALSIYRLFLYIWSSVDGPPDQVMVYRV